MSWSRRRRRDERPSWGLPGHEVALARLAAAVEDRRQRAEVSFAAHLRHAVAAHGSAVADPAPPETPPGPAVAGATAAADGCPSEEEGG
jgi:hypothetical protein